MAEALSLPAVVNGSKLQISLTSNEPYTITATLEAGGGYEEVQLLGTGLQPAVLECSQGLAGVLLRMGSAASSLQNLAFRGCKAGSIEYMAASTPQQHSVVGCWFINNTAMVSLAWPHTHAPPFP